MLSEIQAYTESVQNRSHKCGLEVCPRCQAEATFTRHDARPRTFLVILERLVHEVASLIVRWTCSGCGRHLTDYPPFALPYKRYVHADVVERSGRFVEEDSVTYRAAAGENVQGKILDVHYRGDDDALDDRRFRPSTVHRWITFLGSLVEVFQDAHELIRQADPTSTIFRSPVAVLPRKYRSDERRKLLGQVLRLLKAASRFRRIFGRPLLPNLATIATTS